MLLFEEWKCAVLIGRQEEEQNDRYKKATIEANQEIPAFCIAFLLCADDFFIQFHAARLGRKGTRTNNPNGLVLLRDC